MKQHTSLRASFAIGWQRNVGWIRRAFCVVIHQNQNAFIWWITTQKARLIHPTFLILLMLPLTVFSGQDAFPFKNTTQTQRFQGLLSELRCLVCQNQSLADSNAPLAEELRLKVYAKMRDGQSDKKIIDYLVARYGNFILYRPPFTVATFLLWLGPLIFLLLAGSGLFYFIHTSRKDNLC